MKILPQICGYVIIIVFISQTILLPLYIETNISYNLSRVYNKTLNEGKLTDTINVTKGHSYELTIGIKSTDSGPDAHIKGRVNFLVNNIVFDSDTFDTYGDKYTSQGYNGVSHLNNISAYSITDFFIHKINGDSEFKIIIEISDATESIRPINIQIYKDNIALFGWKYQNLSLLITTFDSLLLIFVGVLMLFEKEIELINWRYSKFWLASAGVIIVNIAVGSGPLINY